MKIPVDLRLALTIILLGVVHETLWQFWPDDLQGDIEAITRWPLIVSICVALASSWRSHNITAACVCVSIMSSTTALCSAWYLIDPWVPIPEQEQCSAHWGPLSMLLSVACALGTLFYLKVMNSPDPGEEL